ncbi:putative zinc ribbon domain protein [bacterium BMS3Abin02]|nr:putative zinc ribbon domain protein [bacterium BMS3Abin02]GBE22789.1 putative zinc ribbon domain protein [bacterium BMS3Bbin01]HDH27135.1 AraC family transcriptional regulator [Actinomycetota bacterium]
MTTTQCISCGMPMSKPEDHAAGDPTKDYCLHCARPDGTMRSRQETREGWTAFMVKTQGIDETAARQAVEEMMARLPAWREN